MLFEIVVPPEVKEQLSQIQDYIHDHDPIAASRFVVRLYERCRSLDTFPNRGQKYSESIRFVVEGPCRVFYRVDEAARKVVIVSMLHAARDVRDL